MNYQDFLRENERALRGWGERIGLLLDLERRGGDGVPAPRRQKVVSLIQKYRSALNKIEKLRQAGSGNWERVRPEVLRSLGELEEAWGCVVPPRLRDHSLVRELTGSRTGPGWPGG